MLNSQAGPHISQASGAVSVPDVLPQRDREHKEHLRYTVPIGALAALSLSSTGAEFASPAWDRVATLLPVAEL